MNVRLYKMLGLSVITIAGFGAILGSRYFSNTQRLTSNYQLPTAAEIAKAYNVGVSQVDYRARGLNVNIYSSKVSNGTFEKLFADLEKTKIGRVVQVRDSIYLDLPQFEACDLNVFPPRKIPHEYASLLSQYAASIESITPNYYITIGMFGSTLDKPNYFYNELKKDGIDANFKQHHCDSKLDEKEEAKLIAGFCLASAIESLVHPLPKNGNFDKYGINLPAVPRCDLTFDNFRLFSNAVRERSKNLAVNTATAAAPVHKK